MAEEDYGIPTRLRKRTRKELKRYGEFGDSYDDLIWRLLKSYKMALSIGPKPERKV